MTLGKLTRFGLSLATGMILLSLVFEAPRMTAGNGKGGGGSSDSGDPQAIATFYDSGTDRIRSDSGGDYIHKDLAVNGGWANFPGTGNFTMKTAGSGKQALENGRKLTIELEAPLPMDDLPPGCDVQPSGQPAPIVFGTSVPAFMSINRNDGNSGGLEAMHLNGSIPAAIGANFADPADNKATYFIRCGLTIGEKNACGTGEVNVDCVDENTAGQCVEWRVEPAINRDQLRCRLWRDKQANSTLIGDFNLPFGLTIFRDADSDGFPD